MNTPTPKVLAFLSVLPLAGTYVLYGIHIQDVVQDPGSLAIALLYLPAALFFTWAVARTGREGRGLCLFLTAGHLAAVVLTLLSPLLLGLEDHWLLFLPMMAAALVWILFSPYPISGLSGWMGDGVLWLALVLYLLCLAVALRARKTT